MSQLASTIEKAARVFAQTILSAVQSSSLQELLALQGEAPTPRQGRPPKAKPGRKAGRPAKAKPGRKPGRPPKAKPGRKPGRPPKAKPGRKPGRKPAAAKVVKAPAKKKRVVKNYPKCSVPGCGKNRFPRGKGMCGEHYKQSLAG
jgi:hypothetical protein